MENRDDYIKYLDALGKESQYFFDRYEPVSIDDKKAILDAMEKEIGITVDGVGRVWTEAGCYIADVIINY